MKSVINIVAITLIATINYGCSSSGSGTTSTPNGIYTGSITGGDTSLNSNEKAIVYNNRMLVISPTADIQQVFDSTMTVDGNNFTTTKSILYSGGSLINNATLSIAGDFESNTSLTATFSDINVVTPSIPNGTINLTFNSSTYNKTSSLNIMAGTWTGPFGFFATATLIVGTNGIFTGSEDATGCIFNGTLSVPDTTVNIYEVALTSTASCPSLPTGSYTGLAWIEGTNNNTLNFSVSNGTTNNRSLILTKI